MRSLQAPFFGVLTFLFCATPTSLPAALIHWSYAWSSSPAEVLADSPGSGKIILTDEAPKTATGDSDIVATNITVSTTASPTSPDVFGDAPYTLRLTLTDTDSGDSGDLIFTGEFSGVVSTGSSIVTNEFTGDVEQSVELGNHKFTVTIGPFSPPGPTGSSNSGSIAAHANVRVEAMIETVPEPTTLALGGLGAALLLWRRRHRLFGRNR